MSRGGAAVSHQRSVIMHEMLVGHTGRWIYGQITDDGQDLLIDALDGVVLEQKGNLAPRTLDNRFQAEIDRFVRFQKNR